MDDLWPVSGIQRPPQSCGSTRGYVTGIYPLSRYPDNIRVNDIPGMKRRAFNLKNKIFVWDKITPWMMGPISGRMRLHNHADNSAGSLCRSTNRSIRHRQMIGCQLEWLCDIKLCSQNNNFPNQHPRPHPQFLRLRHLF